jgi:hypothetical protein
VFDRLRIEKSVLITPGAHFGINRKYFRVGFGYDPEKLKAGLSEIQKFFSNHKFIAPLRHKKSTFAPLRETKKERESKLPLPPIPDLSR